MWRTCGLGSECLPLHGKREGLCWCHCTLPPGMEKVAQEISCDATVGGVPTGLRSRIIGKKWWELL